MNDFPIKLKNEHSVMLKELFFVWNHLDFMGCPLADELDSFNCKLRTWMREEAKKQIGETE